MEKMELLNQERFKVFMFDSLRLNCPEVLYKEILLYKKEVYLPWIKDNPALILKSYWK